MQNGYKDRKAAAMDRRARLVACANIANLLLVRGVSRRLNCHSFGALARACRRRQLLIESVLLQYRRPSPLPSIS
jgi:hypothetical protein